jgi:hypothetical protein
MATLDTRGIRAVVSRGRFRCQKRHVDALSFVARLPDSRLAISWCSTRCACATLIALAPRRLTDGCSVSPGHSPDASGRRSPSAG